MSETRHPYRESPREFFKTYRWTKIYVLACAIFVTLSTILDVHLVSSQYRMHMDEFREEIEPFRPLLDPPVVLCKDHILRSEGPSDSLEWECHSPHQTLTQENGQWVCRCPREKDPR